ncbi:DNA cytosine methyltransferase [Embleya sp. NPDC127516]|uniref:DNA cytosine methyltransferase n=1 Tax=Embleya sp. NPDC127516 TaxID=3363990 RepID=UPI00380941FC
MTLTMTDLFCGAGGSSTGALQVPGVSVRLAANHWRLAVETHNTNHPTTDHDCADLSQVDPRRYPTTDIGWFSPECTNHTNAKGKRRAAAQTSLLDEPPLPDEAAVRSRATMWDVVRFAEHHRYRAIVVENVVEVRDWELFGAWRAALQALGYCVHQVFMNSMFAAALGPAAPQSRDRWYAVAHHGPSPCPDLDRWTRPTAHCPACDRPVRAVQAWKRHDRPGGKYRAQYVWRCPTARCHVEVHPAVRPAADAIDWTVPGQRIGDRPRPLAAKTLARIRAGLAKYARPITLEASGHTFERRPGVRTRPVDAPLTTQTTSITKALAYGPPAAEPRGGGDHGPLSSPVPTEHTFGRPLRPVTAAEHTLVMRNNTPRGDAAQMCTPATEPLRTLTTAGHQSLITWPPLLIPSGGTWNEAALPVDEPMRTRTTSETDALLVPYYGNGKARPIGEPASTVTTIERHALVVADLDVQDCLFRMLAVPEIQAAMAFPDEYVLLGTKRERVRMAGNAVTPPSARDLIAAVVHALTS